MFRTHLTHKVLPAISALMLLGVPLSNAHAHHGGFGRSFGRGIGMGLGGGIGYGVAQYGMHRIFGGYHRHYTDYSPYNSYNYGPYNYAPPPPPPYGGYYGAAAYGPPNVTIINEPPPPPPAPPSDVPNYPYPVPGYTHYQPGSGYTTEPRVTYVPGYGNVPVSSPITP